MENKNSQENKPNTNENPSAVITDIVIKTLITLAIGLVVMYSGLI